jgi:hypothetical protein
MLKERGGATAAVAIVGMNLKLIGGCVLPRGMLIFIS